MRTSSRISWMPREPQQGARHLLPTHAFFISLSINTLFSVPCSLLPLPVFPNHRRSHHQTLQPSQLHHPRAAPAPHGCFRIRSPDHPVASPRHPPLLTGVLPFSRYFLPGSPPAPVYGPFAPLCLLARGGLSCQRSSMRHTANSAAQFPALPTTGSPLPPIPSFFWFCCCCSMYMSGLGSKLRLLSQ